MTKQTKALRCLRVDIVIYSKYWRNSQSSNPGGVVVGRVYQLFEVRLRSLQLLFGDGFSCGVHLKKRDQMEGELMAFGNEK